MSLNRHSFLQKSHYPSKSLFATKTVNLLAMPSMVRIHHLPPLFLGVMQSLNFYSRRVWHIPCYFLQCSPPCLTTTVASTDRVFGMLIHPDALSAIFSPEKLVK